VCAVVAVLGVLVASVERFLPDVHDGDATATQMAAGGVGHGVPAAPDGGAPSDPASHPVPHADHCAHAHGLAVDRGNGGVSEVVAVSSPPDTASDILASVSIRPHQRPPIA
jgi:hypothetical protein